jgi:hypothetical protein
MKKILNLILVLSIALLSFTSSGEENIYESANLNYNVIKTSGVVIITVDLTDVASYDEIIVMRSDKPSGVFRNVKELSKEDINNLAVDHQIIDKYPLPSAMTSYYKLQTVNKSGVYRSYPCVKLNTK